MYVGDRPREALKPGHTPATRLRDTVTLTRREAVCLGAGLGAVVLSWVATFTWL